MEGKISTETTYQYKHDNEKISEAKMKESTTTVQYGFQELQAVIHLCVSLLVFYVTVDV
jgi:hypothetical protein